MFCPTKKQNRDNIWKSNSRINQQNVGDGKAQKTVLEERKEERERERERERRGKKGAKSDQSFAVIVT